MKQGMPREEAKFFAKRYRTMLFDYTSVRSLARMSRLLSGKKENGEGLDIIDPKNSITNTIIPVSESFIAS